MSNVVAVPTTVVGFFESLSMECGANAFVYGGAKRLQEKLRNLEESNYPVVQLERPNVITKSNGSNHEEWYYVSLNVFVKFQRDGEPAEIEASELEAERLAMQVVHAIQNKLHHIRRGIEFDLDGNTKDPILDNYITNHLGWQLSFQIGFNANMFLC